MNYFTLILDLMNFNRYIIVSSIITIRTSNVLKKLECVELLIITTTWVRRGMINFNFDDKFEFNR